MSSNNTELAEKLRIAKHLRNKVNLAAQSALTAFNQRPLTSSKKNQIKYQKKQKSLNSSVLDSAKKNELRNVQNKINKSTLADQSRKRILTMNNQIDQDYNPKMTLKTQADYKQRSTFHKKSKYIHQNQNFQQTKSKLFSVNFNHHNPDNCLCSDCDCGRHMCNLHVVKPDKMNSSIYKKDFVPKQPGDSLYVRPESGKKPIQGPHLKMNTTYGKSYLGRKGQCQKMKPQDCLQFQGPAQNLTTYSSGFPGHYGDNQYIKYQDNVHRNGILSFHGKTSYKQFFTKTNGKKSELATWKNYFKPNQTWLGQSTYNTSFKQRSIEDFPKHVKIIEKKQTNPDFKHQYETIYKNDFVTKDNRQCPARRKIYQTKSGFSNSKNQFNQNSDFKVMSPNFHAISTQGHSFI